MSRIKKLPDCWNQSILFKFMMINFIAIGIVIWLAGVSVKDFACLLINQYKISSGEKNSLFNQTMQFYLIRVSISAVFIATIFYYYLAKKLLLPLHYLTDSIKSITRGQLQEPVEVASKDEIGQLTESFNHLIEKFKQVDESRKKMVSDIAHNLRTPLTNINGYLEALSSGVILGDRELYQSLHDEALCLTNLVEQLHQLNVWESREISTLNTEEIQIEAVIEASLGNFRLEFENRKIAAEVKLQSARIKGNRDGLKQVMDNLLRNAVNYNKGGWINIKGEPEDKMYRVSVTNVGRPIPEDRTEKIFERFYRLEPAGDDESEGSGLGLAIVKEIIGLHGGYVGLSSDENQHTFWFAVPLV